MELKNKMNKVQDTSGDINNRPVQVSVKSLNKYGDGYTENQEREDAGESRHAESVSARRVIKDAQVSGRSWKKTRSEDIGVDADTRFTEGTEVGVGEELDLTGDGIGINRELPKDQNNVTTEEKALKLDEESSAKAETEMAKGLEKLIKNQETAGVVSEQEQTAGGIKNNVENITKHTASGKEIDAEVGKESSVPKSDQGSLAGDKLNEFMDIKNTETLKTTEKTTAPENGESFDSTKLNAKITNITETNNDIAETNKLLKEKEREIKEVDSKIGVLGVEQGATTALVGELEEYRTNLQETKIKLQDQISELQELVQASPEALTALKNSPEATTITEIKALLDSMVETAPTTEIGAVQQENISANKEIAKPRSAEAIIRRENGGLVGAIREAILRIDSTTSKEQIGKVFELFAREILNELTAEGKSHGEALSEYQAMVQALETSNGIIEVALGEDGKMSTHIKNNASETNTPANEADDYNYQMAA